MIFRSTKNLPYLVYDSCHVESISKIIDIKKTRILNLRQNKSKMINGLLAIPSLFNIFTNIDLFKIFLLEGIFIAYICERIKKYKPKFVLTSTDNDIRFYKLKKYNKKVKFIAIQNGLRSYYHDMFEKIDNEVKPELAADYYCVYNDNLKKLITKNIDTKVVVVGSYKNNLVKIKKNIKKKKILYISTFRNHKTDELFDKNSGMFDKKSKNKIFYWRDFLKYETELVKILYEFCKKKKYHLSIAGASVKHSKIENNYFKKILPSKGWKFIHKKYAYQTYNLLDQFEIITSLSNTMGVEAIGRNCKTAFFGRDFSIYNDWLYGWPKKLPKKGFFYSNIISDSEVKRIMNNLIEVRPSVWKLIIKKASKEVMKYDSENTKLKEIFKLNENEKN